MTLLATVLLLCIIMDPFGNMVAINGLLGNYDRHRKQTIILRESLIAYAILVFSALVGTHLLKLLGLEQHALQISGGIVLFIIALGMVFPAKSVMSHEAIADPLVVPIAMPLIAGPSSISIIFLLAHRESILYVLTALTLASLVSLVILWLSPVLFIKLGKRGSIAMERLMGMLLIMISVQMLIDAITEVMHEAG